MLIFLSSEYVIWESCFQAAIKYKEPDLAPYFPFLLFLLEKILLLQYILTSFLSLLSSHLSSTSPHPQMHTPSISLQKSNNNQTGQSQVQ